jgi:cellulose synthase/poly-beta-1,6-N-acetylglucosamine synthase-like glycosyltransferase
MVLENLLDFVLFFVPIGFIFIYFALISYILNTWDQIEETLITGRNHDEQLSFSFVIPARNEAQNIRACLNAVINLDYPIDKIEIIVVDDNSADDIVEIASMLNVKVIKLNHSEGKKAALETGITASKHPWVWTLDADTVLHHKAAKILNEKIIIHNPHFVACPVIIQPDKSVLSRFQFLDMAAMMAITSCGIFNKSYYLANGANMAFLKTAFEDVNGFEGNENIASGDDVFLIKKMAEKYKSKIHFLKSSRAAVITKPMQTYAEFFDQRKRWAAKTKSYANKGLLKIQGYVFFIHLLVVVLLSMGVFLGQGIAFFSGLFVLFIKAVIDFLFLSKMASYFNHKEALKSFIPAFLFYFLYIFYTAYQAAFVSKYSWKGRKHS